MNKLLWFLCLWFSVQTYAAEARLGSHWSKIIDKNISQGVSEIGDFDLRKFQLEAGDIRWTWINQPPASVNSGSRQSASYKKCDKKVEVSRPLPVSAQDSLAQLELHEALGAACYNDSYYALSTALLAISKIEDSIKAQRLARDLGESDLFDNQRLAGGTSIVGGGDLITMFVKMRALTKILASYKPSKEFLTQYLATGFEPLFSDETQVPIQYTYYPGRNGRGAREMFVVLVPMTRWNQGQQAHASVIEEVVRKLTSLFPVTSNTRLQSFRPSRCSSNRGTISYPPPSDKMMARIQDYRGAIQLGCKTLDPNNTSSSITAPDLEGREEEPLQSGQFHFRCSFSYGGRAGISQLVASPAGQSSVNSKVWGLNSEDTLFGDLAVGPSGEILWIGFSYTKPGDPSPQFLKGILGKTPEGEPTGRVTMKVKGIDLAFTCARKH